MKKWLHIVLFEVIPFLLIALGWFLAIFYYGFGY